MNKNLIKAGDISHTIYYGCTIIKSRFKSYSQKKQHIEATFNINGFLESCDSINDLIKFIINATKHIEEYKRHNFTLQCFKYYNTNYERIPIKIIGFINDDIQKILNLR